MHGITVKEKRITRDELYISDEIFFYKNLEITPISQVDGRNIGDGKTGCALGNYKKPIWMSSTVKIINISMTLIIFLACL